MDFFGFGSSSNQAIVDANSPLGFLIIAGTDALLPESDWARFCLYQFNPTWQLRRLIFTLCPRNLDICDVVNSTPGGPEQAAAALLRRLQEQDTNIIFLSLIVLEACMKNCGRSFAQALQAQHRPKVNAVTDTNLMEEIVGIARGNKGQKNASEARRLIQDWGIEFESDKDQFPIFFETYLSLKAKGVAFAAETAHKQSPSSESSRRSVVSMLFERLTRT